MSIFEIFVLGTITLGSGALLAVRYNKNKTRKNSPNTNTNSGNTNSGNTNTNSGNTNTNSGNTNSGNTNSGNTNSGNTNSGNTNSGNHSPTTNGPNSPIVGVNYSPVTQNIQQLTRPQSIKIKLTIELNQMAIEVLDAIYIRLKEEYNSNPECCTFYFEDNHPGPFLNLIKGIIPDKDQRITVMSHMCYNKKFFEKTQDGAWRLTDSGFEAAFGIHYELHKKEYSCLDYIDI